MMKDKREVRELRLSGPVRITLPAKVAYNLDSLQSSIASIMERLGCPTCFSGADCVFRLEREFVINPQAKIERANPILLFGASDPDGDPIMPAVNAVLDAEVSHDINQVQKAIANIVDRLGHPQCMSGFDMLFRSQIELITVDKQLNVEIFGRV